MTSAESTTFDYKQTVTYDPRGQVKKVKVVDYTGTSAVTKNYTYTYENDPEVSTPSEYDVQRLTSVSDGTRTAFYEYSTDGIYTTKTETVKEGNTVLFQTSTMTSLITKPDEGYTVMQLQNGTETKIEYALKGGNIRPYKVTSGGITTEYAYNYDGEITSVKTGDLTQETYYSGGNGKESSYYLGGSERYSLTRNTSKFGLVTGIEHTEVG